MPLYHSGIIYQESLEHAKDDEINNIILTGDFNSDPIKNSRNYGWLTRTCSNLNLENRISEPTRITEQSQTCLDLFLSNLQDKVNIARVSHPVGNSDHITVELQIKLNFHINKNANFDFFL